MLWKRSVKPFAKSMSFLILSSIFIIFSFPKINFYYFCFIALVPWIYVIYDEVKLKNVLIKSFIVGLFTYLGLMYWLVPMFYVAGLNKIIGIVLFVFMCSYLAVYYAFWGACLYYARRKLNLNYFWYAIFAACSWVALELFRNYFLTGFPWALLGYSQWKNLMLIQISEYTGVYGVSFVIVFCNMCLFFIFKNINKNKRVFFIGLLAVLFSVILAFGYFKLHENKFSDDKIGFAILQGNIDQYKKFDYDYLWFIKNRYKDLAMLASEKQDVDVILWPETSVPVLYPYDNIGSLWFTNLVASTRKYNLAGMFYFSDGKEYNTVISFDDTGREKNRYAKRHLVPFGEFFPFQDLISKFIKMAESLGGASRGERLELLPVNGYMVGATICFESLFPNEMREFVNAGANMFVNVSNDAWYLNTSAPWHLLSFNIFRAIENRRWLVRAANTGISAFIDDQGRIVESLGLFKTGIIDHKVELVSKKTCYTKHGDVFAYVCVLVMVLFVLLNIFIARNRKRGYNI